jgi:DNA polymerase I-like protein with 3'-5' exonuclease and polymerase domains
LLKKYTEEIKRYRKILVKAKTRWLLQVHDESLWVCEKSAAEEVANICAKIMCMRHFFPQIYPFCVPLVVEGGIGENWKQAKEAETIKYGLDEEYDD